MSSIIWVRYSLPTKALLTPMVKGPFFASVDEPGWLGLTSEQPAASRVPSDPADKAMKVLRLM